MALRANCGREVHSVAVAASPLPALAFPHLRSLASLTFLPLPASLLLLPCLTRSRRWRWLRGLREDEAQGGPQVSAPLQRLGD